jgi:hypothetical protein
MGSQWRHHDASCRYKTEQVLATVNDLMPGGTAAVAWMGYRPPQGSDVVFDDAAEQGAPLLAQLTARLPGRVTVIGNSYGSVVVGVAARHGLAADAVVFTGSPGVSAADRSEFRLRGPHATVWAAGHAADPVVQSRWFGAAPTDGAFGADGVLPGPRITFTKPVVHSEYFATERTRRAVAKVVIGVPPDTLRAPGPVRRIMQRAAGVVSSLLRAVVRPFARPSHQPKPMNPGWFSADTKT